MTDQTAEGFIPPAAEGLPAGTLEAAEIGANRLDAWARTPHGRNFLAHALVQLARTGWLRTEPGEGFEPLRDRETPEPQDAPAVPAEAGPADTVGQDGGEALCGCGHGRAYHDFEYGGPRCRLCPERGEWTWAHAFQPAAAQQPDAAS
jgi:hypothetical protein